MDIVNLRRREEMDLEDIGDKGFSVFTYVEKQISDIGTTNVGGGIWS